MILTNPAITTRGDETYLSSNIIFEDAKRPTQEVYYAVPNEFKAFLSEDCHSFLIPAAIMAMKFGEKRIKTDVPVCSRLIPGIKETFRILSFWHYNNEGSFPTIEAPIATHDDAPKGLEKKYTAGFFSGGVDAFSMFRENQRDYPDPNDEQRINLAIFVSGFEIGDLEVAKIAEEKMRENVHAMGMKMLPVKTNMYLHLRDWDSQDDFHFWHDHLQGAAFSGVAHALANGISHCSIAASVYFSTIDFHSGTHPMIDTRLRTKGLEIHHEGVMLTRMEKVQGIADWDVVLKGLRVCNRYQTYTKDSVNCGQCEKCVRSMLEFVACDAQVPDALFNRKPTFTENELRKHYPKISSKSIYQTSWDEIYEKLDAQKHPELKATLALMYDKKWTTKVKVKNFARAQKQQIKDRVKAVLQGKDSKKAYNGEHVNVS